MKHAMTIDIEEHFQVAAFKNVFSPTSWSKQSSRVEGNTNRFLEMADDSGIKATFFVLGWVAERFPKLIKRIHDSGHEIASHGYSHQLIYNQAYEVFRQETSDSKKILEDICQTKVRGYRAASYSITKNSLWALDIIAESGFEYDSSIYPVKHDNYGLQGGPFVPHRLELNAGKTLLEFPITTTRLLGVNVPVGGGGYFRIYPFALTKKLLNRRVGQFSAPFVFYLHPWELDPEQPRVPSASALSKFRHYINLDKVEERLKQLFDLYEFTTMGEVLDSLPDVPKHSY